MRNAVCKAMKTPDLGRSLASGVVLVVSSSGGFFYHLRVINTLHTWGKGRRAAEFPRD